MTVIILFDLIEDLQATGPIQKGWKNFSPLNDKKTEFHCHLDYEAFAMSIELTCFWLFLPVLMLCIREEMLLT